MPIDAALLRWEDTYKEVEQWQKARTVGSSSKDYVALTREAEEEYREIKKKLGLARHEYKKHKQKEFMIELEQSAQQKYNELQNVLLPKLGNMIDDDNNDNCAQSTIQEKNRQIQQDCRQKLEDECWKYFHDDDRLKFYHAFLKDDEIMIRKNPLYSIGGCELIVLSCHGDYNLRNKQATKMVLTRFGKELNHSLEEYRNTIISSDQSIHVPRYTQISKHMAHAMLGCRHEEDTTGIVDEKVVQVPSWMSFLGTQQQWKKMSDSQLPYICTFPYYTNEYDEEYGHELEKLHLCAFTSPTLVESRTMQDQLVLQMLTYFSSLLLLPSVKSNQSEGQCVVRIRALSKEELGWSEAKHIVVEGYMPSKRQYIPLGYVSNTTDYITRVHSLSFIGGGQKQQDKSYVHLVHAELAPSTITLSWLLEHNIASITQPSHHGKSDSPRLQAKNLDNLTKSIGIIMPPCLKHSFTKLTVHNNNNDDDKENSLFFIPFQRLWKHGNKKGKVIFQQIHPPPFPHYLKPLKEDNNHHPNQDMIDSNISNTNLNDIYTQGDMSPKFPPLSKIPLDKEKDKLIIRGEALCSPHDFLPFFCT